MKYLCRVLSGVERVLEADISEIDLYKARAIYLSPICCYTRSMYWDIYDENWASCSIKSFLLYLFTFNLVQFHSVISVNHFPLLHCTNSRSMHVVGSFCKNCSWITNVYRYYHITIQEFSGLIVVSSGLIESRNIHGRRMTETLTFVYETLSCDHLSQNYCFKWYCLCCTRWTQGLSLG